MGDAGQVLSLQYDISPRKPPATWPRRPSVLRTINLPLPHPSHWLPPSHLHPGALCLSLSMSLPSFLHPGGGKVPRPSRRGKSAPHHGNTQEAGITSHRTERRSPNCGVCGSGPHLSSSSKAGPANSSCMCAVVYFSLQPHGL